MCQANPYVVVTLMKLNIKMSFRKRGTGTNMYAKFPNLNALGKAT